MGEIATEDIPTPPVDVLRRNRPGSKRADWSNWPDQEFCNMESIHAAQMLIQQRIRNCRLKNNKEIDKILEKPEGADEDVWKYEHLRQFCQELNGLATRLQDGGCSPTTCPQMTATDQWIFLCAAHKSPKECSAIDYTRHTLDGAANLLNNSKYFPSRVSLKLASVTKLGSVSRRIYRIFSHAYFHHRQIFLDFENTNQLCRRFTKFVTMYDLMPKDNLIVPVDSLESGLSSTTSSNSNAASTEKDSGVPNEEFYSSATIARPIAEPKETNSDEPTAQAASQASNDTQEWNGDETVITNPSDTTITEAE